MSKYHNKTFNSPEGIRLIDTPVVIPVIADFKLSTPLRELDSLIRG